MQRKHYIGIIDRYTLPKQVQEVLSPEDTAPLAVVERNEGLFVKLCTLADTPEQAEDLASSYARTYGALRG